ncbi:glycerophosphodiester phosphodiesterase family protein [Vreelandella massiliensis]|uniref:glycerophosphodiester phosphodiesterase family protein n=1 Tax=Vreelandella massiliensis TaxID=1816686 RepID=UPI0009FA26F5|nr:glycerophosphodiester phosphodiesterase family protein [Halomonas massiliensis]
MPSPTFTMQTPPAVMGHRGIPSLAPENTLGGFRKAADVGVRWIELDVTLLSDGTPVVSHDTTTARCGNHATRLDQLTIDSLDGLDMAAHVEHWPAEPLPLLVDTLRLLSTLGMGLNLEIKDYGLPTADVVAAVVNALQSTDFPSETLIISSFSLNLLAETLNQAPHVRRGWIITDLPNDWRTEAERLALFSLHADWRHLNPQRVQAIKQAGLYLYAWTANAPSEVASLWHWGLDGVITDYPQRFMTTHEAK